MKLCTNQRLAKKWTTFPKLLPARARLAPWLVSGADREEREWQRIILPSIRSDPGVDVVRRARMRTNGPHGSAAVTLQAQELSLCVV